MQVTLAMHQSCCTCVLAIHIYVPFRFIPGVRESYTCTGTFKLQVSHGVLPMADHMTSDMTGLLTTCLFGIRSRLAHYWIFIKLWFLLIYCAVAMVLDYEIQVQ